MTKIYSVGAFFFSFLLIATLLFSSLPTQTFADDTTFKSPTANAANNAGTGDDWDNPNNAHADGGGAASEANNESHRFYNYSLGVPAGATINGIEVRVDAWSSDNAGCQLGVDLSWDGGSNWVTEKAQSLTGAETTYTLGGVGDNWGRVWSAGDFSDANFRTRVRDIDPGGACNGDPSLDWIQVRVTYTPPLPGGPLSPIQVVASNSIGGSTNGAFTSDNTDATFNSNSDFVEYGFGDFNLPANAVIDGIEVSAEGTRGSNFPSTGRQLTIGLWNTSESPDAYSSLKTTNFNSPSTDSIVVLGNGTDKWGKTWTVGDFASGVFKVRVGANSGNDTAALDHLQVKIHYTLDIIAPETIIDTNPVNPTNSTSASFTFSSEPGATFECQLDGGGFSACTSPKNYAGPLLDGSHTFEVRAIDAALNVDESPASYTWTVDTAEPVTSITGATDGDAETVVDGGVTNSDDISIAFNADGTGSAITISECQLDGGLYATCTSPFVQNDLLDGTHTVNIRSTDAAGNLESTANFTWTIDTVAPVITILGGNPTEIQYGNDYTDAGATALDDRDGNLTGSIGVSSNVNVSELGSYSVTYSVSDEAGNVTNEIRTVNVSEREITITPDAGQTKTYGDLDPTFAYQVTSGSIVDGDIATGALSRVAGEDVGLYDITLGDLSYGEKYDVTFTTGVDFEIEPLTVNVTPVEGQNKIYGDADPVLLYDNDTLVAGDSFTGALSRVAGENAGTYEITQGTLALSTNYVLNFTEDILFTIEPKTINVTADSVSKTYGDADPALTYTAPDLVGGDLFSGSLTRVPGENVGEYEILQGTLTLSSNYEMGFGGAALTINPRSIEVTADAKSKTYGDADPALTYQITDGSLAFSDEFSGALTRDAGETVGSYAINQGALTLGSNYNLSYIGANLTIGTRVIEVTATAGQNKVYGDTDPAFAYTITSGSLAFSDAFDGSLSRASGEDVGLYAINQGTLSLPSDYTLTFVGNDFEILAKNINVIVNPGQGKIYGETDPALTYTADPLAFSDTFSGALARSAGETVGTYPISQGTLTAGGNYAINFTGNSFEISSRDITVTADPQTKVYGTTDPILTYQITSGSLAFSDAFDGSLSRASGEDVGLYAINQGTLSLPSDYDLTFESDDLEITKAAVEVVATAQDKVYDGDAEADVTLDVTGEANSEVLGAMYSTALFDNENVGTNKLVTVSGITLTGATKDNYTFNTSATDNADITGLGLTANVTVANKTYDGTTSATILTRTLNGVIGSDDVTISGGTATFADANAGNGKAVSVTGLTLGGADAGNYSFDGTAATTANITKAVTGITITNAFDLAVAPSVVGEPVTVSWSVSESTAGTPTGTVTVSVTGNPGCSAPVEAGSCELAFDAPTVGSVVVFATYAGDSNFIGSLSSSAPHTVVKADTAVTITNAAALASTPTTVGQSYTVEWDVDVVAPGNAPITGTVTVTGGSGCAAPVEVGSCELTSTEAGLKNLVATYGGNSNLNGDASDAAPHTVDKAVLTVTADNQSKTYGEADPTFTRVITGYVGGVDSTLTTEPTCTVAVPHDDAGSYPITCAGGDDDNYTFAYVDGTLTVGQLNLTVSATGINKVYDDTTAATVTLSDNRVSGDNITTGYASAVFADQHVGTGKNVSVSGITVTGPDAVNYTANTTANTTANITVAPLTITAQTNSKPFDGTTSAAAVPVATGNLGDDTVTGLAETYDTATVGTGKTLSVSTYTINDDNGGNNYDVTLVDDETGEITVASATITLGDLVHTYDGTQKSATVTTNPLGLSHDVTYDGSPTAPTDAGNYEVIATITDGSYAGSATDTLVINKADQTITFDALTDKTIGDPDFDLLATSDSTLTVTFAALGDCSMADVDTVHLDAIGSCTITASQVGNDNYNAATPVERTFAINDVPAPIITLEDAGDATLDSITVTWTTDHPATSRVVYDTVSHDGSDPAPNYGYAFSTGEDANLVTSHSVVVTGLASGTTYYFRGVSHGSPESISNEVSETTLTPEPQTGSLKVTKTAVGGNDTFTFTGPNGSFDITTAGGTGEATIANLTPGNYSVTETVPSGWTKTGDTCQNVAVSANAEATCEITNTKDIVPPTGFGKLKVVKKTVGGNGSFSFTGDAGSFNITTKYGSGSRTIKNLPVGTYTVEENVPDGWTLTSNGCVGITVVANQTVTCEIVNTKIPPQPKGSISGIKFNDKNGNGVKDWGESKMWGWLIYLDKNNDGHLNWGEQWRITDIGGKYSFKNLTTGTTYHVREVMRNGWTQTAPASGVYDIELASGQNSTGNDFGNKRDNGSHYRMQMDDGMVNMSSLAPEEETTTPPEENGDGNSGDNTLAPQDTPTEPTPEDVPTEPTPEETPSEPAPQENNPEGNTNDWRKDRRDRIFKFFDAFRNEFERRGN